MGEPETDAQREERLLVGVYADLHGARQALDWLDRAGHPLDTVSVLGKGEAVGDDPLGIYYSGVEERVKGWGGIGALWGGLWGLLAGGAGVFLLPGLGPILVAGPIVNAIVGGAAGAAVGGGAMAGAAALSGVALAFRRMGVPEERLEHLHQAIVEGKHVLLLRCHRPQLPTCKAGLEAGHPLEVHDFPWQGLS